MGGSLVLQIRHQLPCELLAARGVNGEHSTIYLWIQRYAPDVEHRQIKYRNNVIECDHGKLKRIIGATLGLKSMKTLRHTQRY